MTKRARFPQPIYYKAGYKYQLQADYAIDLTRDIPALPVVWADTKFITIQQGVLTVKNGYAWDGPSGPTIDTPAGIYASLVHDALYQLCRAQLISASLRPQIDKLFAAMLRDGGMWGVRARIWFNGVRVGGGAHVGVADEPPVLTAP